MVPNEIKPLVGPTTTAINGTQMNSQINEYKGTKRDRDTWVATNANTAVFIQKTYDMINRCDPNIASWNETGDTFIVKDSTKLAKMYIPRYFDHSNFSSFSRQLNFYGFRKINNLHDTDGYTSSHVRFHHEFFCKERPELLSKIKRSTLNNSNSKLVNKEVEALKVTVSNLEEQIATMSSDFEMKMREMYNMMQQRQCTCTCGISNEPTNHEKTMARHEHMPAPTNPPEQPLPKRVKIFDNHSLYKHDYEEITSLPNLRETNFERQQSVQSTDFLVSLINDETLDPSEDCVELPFSNLDPDQLLSFPERSISTSSNALPPLPASLTRMPEIGIIRFLSDLSASRATSLGEKDKKVTDWSTPVTSTN